MEPELRDWYLSTIGVVQYRLRSASPVVVSELVANEQAKTQGVEISHSAQPVSGIPQSLRDSLEQSTDIAPDVSAPLPGSTEQIKEPVEGQQIDDAIAFRLACWRPSEDLLVIDSWPLGQDGDNRLSQLLGNILKAIQRKPGAVMQPEFVDWPIGGDGSLPAAREHLAMFIQGRYDQQAFQWLLAMGDDIRLCLTAGDSSNNELSDNELSNDEQADKAKPRLSLDCGAEAILTRSLSDMLAMPMCKKEVWSAIRFLCS